MAGLPPGVGYERAPAPAGMKERLLSWLVNRVLRSSNQRLDIAGLQAQHGAFQEKVTRLQVEDLGRVWDFQVRAGRLQLVEGASRPDGGIVTRSDTLISIALGRRRMMDPATGREYEVEYSPIDALTHGDLRIWGDAATNDALLFARAVYAQVYGKLRDDLAQPPPSR